MAKRKSKKDGTEVQQIEKRQRQLQVSLPGIQITFVSEYDFENIDYMIGRVNQLIDKYKK